MSEIKIGPPPVPNRSKYPFVGTAEVQGIKINIENLAGSIREGKDASGRTWRTRMKYHYGEIANAKAGADRDKLDVYLGPNPNAKMVYVIHQNFPKDHPDKPGEYDEDKTMLGYDSPDAAKRAYLKQYNRPDFFRSMTIMTLAQFKKVMTEDPGQKVAAIKRAAEKVDDCKRRRPSAFIRMRLREGGEKNAAYELGVKLALIDARLGSGRPELPAPNSTDLVQRDMSFGALKPPQKLKNFAPAPTSSGTFAGTGTGASEGTITTWSTRHA